jgi:hypothetical protein
MKRFLRQVVIGVIVGVIVSALTGSVTAGSVVGLGIAGVTSFLGGDSVDV